MLGLHNRLRRKDEEVIAKAMDGEAVIINLANGVYYSVDNVGGAIWEMMNDGWRMDEIVAAITARYDVPLPRAEADVLRLGADLLREELVALAAPDDTPRRKIEAAPTLKLPYESPQLNIYRDMQDLLALDPPTPGFADIPWKE